MARQTYEAWLPEDRQSAVIGRITQTSAVEQYANRVPMNTNTKAYPRSAAMGVDEVPKGSAYGEDVSPNDEIILNAKKFGKVVRIAEEDIDDNVIDLINDRKLAWATAYAKFIDNAALGTNAAPGVGVPFDSVYHRVTTADASTTAPYVANANYMSTTSGAPSASPSRPPSRSSKTSADRSGSCPVAGSQAPVTGPP
jgi:HK97 family phage major capsid protein